MSANKKLSSTVLVVLLTAAAVGVAAVALMPAKTLLPGTFAAAALLGLVSVLVARRNAYLKRNQYFGRQSNDQGPQAPGQLLVLMIGLTVIATFAGFGTAWKTVISAVPVVAAAPAPAPASEAPASPSPSPTPTPTPEESPSPSETAGPPPAVDTQSPESDFPEPPSETIAYLDSMDTIEGDVESGARYLSAKRYPRSIEMYCSRNGNFNEWNVGGRTSLSATLGIADDANDSFGAIAEFIFYDQDGRQLGKAYIVSIGHPETIQLDLTSVVRLRITCSGRDSKTNDGRSFYAVLGDAYVKS